MSHLRSHAPVDRAPDQAGSLAVPRHPGALSRSRTLAPSARSIRRRRRGTMQEPGASESASVASESGSGRLREALDRRADWIEALIILTTLAIGFVVLGFLASYFDNYSRIILIFFFAWLL